MVDLQKPGLCEIVQVYVEAKNLEAERILQVLRLGGSVKMVHLMNSSKQCLDADLLDFRPHFIGGHYFIFRGTRGINVLEYRCETSFVANIVSRSILILLESRTLFVDGIVRQVHTKVIQIALYRALVLFGCKSGETLFVYETSQR